MVRLPVCMNTSAGMPETELQPGQPAAFFLRQRDPDREIGHIGLRVAGGIGRDIRHLADQLRRHPLVEGREADVGLLALPHLIDIVRLQPRLDLQIIGIRHHLHDGVAGANDAADGVDVELMDHPRRRRAHLDAVEHVARGDASLGKFGFLALRLAEVLDDLGPQILIERGRSEAAPRRSWLWSRQSRKSIGRARLRSARSRAAGS